MAFIRQNHCGCHQCCGSESSNFFRIRIIPIFSDTNHQIPFGSGSSDSFGSESSDSFWIRIIRFLSDPNHPIPFGSESSDYFRILSIRFLSDPNYPIPLGPNYPIPFGSESDSLAYPNPIPIISEFDSSRIRIRFVLDPNPMLNPGFVSTSE